MDCRFLLLATSVLASVSGRYAAAAEAESAPTNENAGQEIAKPQSSRGDLLQGIREFPFWTDQAFFGRNRLQRNVLTGRYRVRGEGPFSKELGSREECVDWLEAQVGDQDLPDDWNEREAVVFIHGLARSPRMWSSHQKAFEKASYATYQFEYASTRQPIADVGDALADSIRSIGQHPRTHLVVHSMGGLVTRAYFAKHVDQAEDELDRYGRVVMLGTPNRGAQMADNLHRLKAFQVLFGQPGQELTSGPFGLGGRLPAPPVEFATVAGSFPKTGGLNPFVEGDDDGLVAVESTFLGGAADSLVIPNVLHHALLRDKRAVAAALSFVETGALTEAGPRQPTEAGE
ncbi:esterase/lipase family protein [Stratiformator vulcanicus]|nr:alpha/beta fold hydrolase [Stratiformator vulcanicus]